MNGDIEARSRDPITSSTFLAGRYGVLSSSKFTISISLFIINKSAKKMLNGDGTKIEPCGTPIIIVSHLLYELLTLVLSFLCDR